MKNKKKPDDLRTRLVCALMDALKDGDPVLVIGVGEDELRLSWQSDMVREVLEQVRDRADDDDAGLGDSAKPSITIKSYDSTAGQEADMGKKKAKWWERLELRSY